MSWAASHLLKQDWPENNRTLHGQAMAKLGAMLESVDKAQARTLREAAQKQRERDLIIRLRWQGQADLDLKVKEPAGSICSARNRISVGGGTLLGDTLRSRDEETYVAAKGFSGEYEITVDRVWGRPLGGKAQLQIIRHQGTEQESTKIVMLKLKEKNVFKLELTEGRRMEAASVPPEDLRKDRTKQVRQKARIYQKLRDLAMPEVTGMGRGLSGTLGSLARTVETTESAKPIRPEDTLKDQYLGGRTFRNRVSPFVTNSVSLTSQAVISSDRRYVRLSVNPFFNTVTGTRLQPIIRSLPGFRP